MRITAAIVLLIFAIIGTGAAGIGASRTAPSAVTNITQ